MYHKLKIFSTEAEYRTYYIEEYCKKQVYCHDGTEVRFHPEDFDHAFFQSANRRAGDKSIFSIGRAQRIDWIKKALQDSTLVHYAGWDTKRKRYDASRRVCLVTPDGYVIVLRVTGEKSCRFNTAYVIDDPSVERKIKGSPVWSP